MSAHGYRTQQTIINWGNHKLGLVKLPLVESIAENIHFTAEVGTNSQWNSLYYNICIKSFYG
jgi:hypothetical protein